jgi:DNA repair protein RecN (Recombination protein N)
MLRRLHLRDFVLVDEIDLEFGAGFSVLTGETGAGKSILVDALKLALGERGDASVLRAGSTRAEIAATFDTPAELAEWLDEQGFEGGDEVLLRRLIDAQGRSRAFINGSPATLAQLRAVGERLVDIHGQHAWQSLVRADAARDLLDAYAQAGAQRQACAQAWRAWKALDERLHAARHDAGARDTEREWLVAQLAELERLAPLADEWDALNAEQHRLAHAAELIEQLQLAAGSVDDDEDGARRRLLVGRHALHDAARIDATLAPLLEQVDAAEAQLRELARELGARLRTLDLDPERLRLVDARLSAWLTLARRHRVAPDALPEQLQALRARLAELEQQVDVDALQREVDAALQALRVAAGALSARRHDAATRLAGGVVAQMQRLGMEGARFEVALLPLAAAQAGGAESVELRVAGHAGAPMRALARVASGGELSRIALAVAATSAAQQTVGTLVFDEVDAGVGGAVAHTVGDLLARLGRERQVLAVTHLAQVAACADGHLQVVKESAGGSSRSRIEVLGGEARVAELARMLGGDAQSGVALEHARELLGDAAARSQEPC